MVFAFAGDSTITKFSCIYTLFLNTTKTYVRAIGLSSIVILFYFTNV